MNKNTGLYYQSACALKLPTSMLQQMDGFAVNLGLRRYFFRGGETPFNCGSSLGVANNKYCTNKILAAAGFPVPKADAIGKDLYNNTNLEALIEHFNFPLVVKPTTGTMEGRDVLCNIGNRQQLHSYMKKCFQDHQFLSIEEFHGGLNSYRVLVFYYKVIGVVQRFPAKVIGDGIHTIRELIEINNCERERLKGSVSLGPIKVDEEYQIRLNELQMTLETIPQNNETVVLCYTCNSTRGGTMESLGKKICVENARMLCQAARALNLNIVGFDVACEDILVPIETSRGVIIEANQNPDITIHEHPILGISNQVSKKILRRLILRHPVAYFLGLFRKKHGVFYLKVSLISIVLLAWTLMNRGHS